MRWADTTRSSDGTSELHEHGTGRLEHREVRAAAADDADDRRSLARSLIDRASFLAVVGPAQLVAGGAGRGERRLRVVGRWPSGGPSCGARRPAACRTGGGGRPVLERPPDRARIEPRVAQGALAPQVDHRRRRQRASVAPSSSPQIARMCCSNCEVAAPSIVQWPLLWTRGASSLTTRRPSGMRNSSAVRVPRHAHGQRPAARRGRRPRSATSSGTGAGATLSTRMPASWRCGRAGRSPSRRRSPRATMIESSAAKASSRSARTGSPGGRPEGRPGAADARPRRPTRTWPRPS